jgi:O-antigen ligase
LIAPVSRLGAALQVTPGVALLIAGCGLIGVASVSALAAFAGVLPMALGLVAVVVLAALGIRWPLLPLVLFAALIPIEEVVVIDGFGTATKVLGILFAVVYGVPRIGHLRLGAMPPAAWAYLAWAILSLGWAVDAGTSWSLLATLLQLFVIAFLVADYVVQRPGIVRPILWAYSLAAAVTALIGVQSYLAQGLGVARATAIQNQDPAQFAAVLVPAVVFGLYELASGERRVLGGVIAVLAATGVVVSGTRGAWVACTVVVVLFVLPQLAPRARLAAVGAILVLLVIAYQIPGVPELVAERTGSALTTGGAGRSDIWSVAGTIYRSAPVLGVGYANFPVAYTSEAIRAAGISRYLVLGAGAHSVLVSTLVELGPIGLMLLAAFVLPLVLRRGWGADAATIRAMLASLLILALFLDVLANRKQVWLVLGVACGLSYLARQRRGAAVGPDEVRATPGITTGSSTDPVSAEETIPA